MDAPPSSPEAAPPALKNPRYTAIRLALVVSGVLLLSVGLLVLLVYEGSNTKIVWLTPTEAANISAPQKPGALTALKQKLAKLAPSLWQKLRGNRPKIKVWATYAISPGSTAQSALGEALSTNADGFRVWVLTSERLAAFELSLRTGSNGPLLGPVNFVMESNPQATRSLPMGRGPETITIDLAVRVALGTVNLSIAALSTESGGYSNGQPVLSTNFSTACRVLVPDAGGFVINFCNTNSTKGTDYWLILSPSVLDTNGQPVKH